MVLHIGIHYNEQRIYDGPAADNMIPDLIAGESGRVNRSQNVTSVGLLAAGCIRKQCQPRIVAKIYPTDEVRCLGCCRHRHLKEIAVVQCEGVGLDVERRNKRYLVGIAVVSKSVDSICIYVSHHQVAVLEHIGLEDFSYPGVCGYVYGV